MVKEKIIGRVDKVFVNPPSKSGQSKIYQSIEQPIVYADRNGIIGDRHYGPTRKVHTRDQILVPSYYKRGAQKIHNNRSWSATSLEENQAIAHSLGLTELPADWIGSNFSVKDIEYFSKLPSGTRIKFENGLVLVVCETNTPCNYALKTVEEKGLVSREQRYKFAHTAQHRRGLVGYIDSISPNTFTASIKPGDHFQIHLPNGLQTTSEAAEQYDTLQSKLAEIKDRRRE